MADKATNAPAFGEAKVTTVDALMATDPSTWEFVTIPGENALGEVHSDISLNKLRFEAGNTYKVPAKIAEFVRERLQIYAKSCVRVLQPKRDTAAEQAVSIGSVSGSRFTPVDATQIQTA